VDENIRIRGMNPGEESVVMALVRPVFDRFEAPEYSPQGVEEFYRFAHPESMRLRAGNHFCLVAEIDHKMVGMIEIRTCNHIALLFVDASYHRRGLATALFEAALVECRRRAGNLHEFSVNSSPYAIAFYRSVGFRETAIEQVVNGLRFTPMVLTFQPCVEN
jgi:GNAT superfamily N-acetyltransferase